MIKQPETIQSIDRALDVLMLFSQERRELGVTQISEALGFQKSTVHRILSTLERRGFIQQNPDNGRYWLGIKLYSLGMLMREQQTLPGLVAPHARALAERFKEVVHLSVLDQAIEQYPRHIIIDKIESSQVLSLTPPVGSSAACHCSGGGKCLLAYSKPEFLQQFNEAELPRFTPNTITSWAALQPELVQIRQQGYAVDAEEMELGLTCVASPIFGRGGALLAALSLSGPTSRLRSAQFAEMVAALQSVTRQISDYLSN